MDDVPSLDASIDGTMSKDRCSRPDKFVAGTHLDRKLLGQETTCSVALAETNQLAQIRSLGLAVPCKVIIRRLTHCSFLDSADVLDLRLNRLNADFE